MKKTQEIENTPPSFIFDITPGLEVRNAVISEEEIAVDSSVFSQHQMAILDRLISVEVVKEIAEKERDFQEKLNEERRLFEQEKERFELEIEKFESEKKSIWQNGNQAGIKQTQNQLLSQVTALTDQLKKTIESLSLNTEEVMQYHSEEILKLIVKITRKVINVEVKLNPEIVLSTVKNCLEYVNDKEEVRIFVNPKDWAIVSENLKELDLAMELPEKTEIIALENIEQGGCRVEFKSGSIDADIESQFHEIQRKVLKDV